MGIVEYALCVVVGVLLGVWLCKDQRKTRKTVAKPTEEEKRLAEKVAREYRNFMTYDGFSSQGEENE